MNINLTTENAQNTLGAGFDTLISIENVIGTRFRRSAGRQFRSATGSKAAAATTSSTAPPVTTYCSAAPATTP